jgi:hypothetical protein
VGVVPHVPISTLPLQGVPLAIVTGGGVCILAGSHTHCSVGQKSANASHHGTHCTNRRAANDDVWRRNVRVSEPLVSECCTGTLLRLTYPICLICSAPALIGHEHKAQHKAQLCM